MKRKSTKNKAPSKACYKKSERCTGFIQMCVTRKFIVRNDNGEPIYSEWDKHPVCRIHQCAGCGKCENHCAQLDHLFSSSF